MFWIKKQNTVLRHEGGPCNIKIHDLYWNKKIGQYFEFFLEFRTNLSEYLLFAPRIRIYLTKEIIGTQKKV